MPYLETRIKDLHRKGDLSRLFTVKMFPPPNDKLRTLHGDYRYQFRGPPHQMNDEVVRMAIGLIHELSKQDMIFGAAGFRIHNMDSTHPIWPCPGSGAIKLYAFQQALEEFPIATEITICRGARELTTDNILVWKKWRGELAKAERWTPLKEWLLKLPIPSFPLEGTMRDGVLRFVRYQQLWWDRQGKPFRLMGLPLEI